MKYIVLLVALLCFYTRVCVCQTPQLDTTCLRLYFSDSTNNALYNRDSMMIDTCHIKSPQDVNNNAWLKLIQIGFYRTGMIHVPLAPADTILEVPWTAIDTTLADVRAGFKALYDSVGPFVLRKITPNDTTGSPSVYFKIRFLSYTWAGLAMGFVTQIPKVTWRDPFPTLPAGHNGVKETITSDVLSIFPQPADREVFVSISQIEAPENSTLLADPKLYDLLGHALELRVITVKDGLYKFDVSRLPYGVYFLSVGGIQKPVIVTSGR